MSYLFLLLFSDGQYIIGGSDDGYLFIWDTETCNVIGIWQGDGRVVNCVQPAPSYGMIATSGIDNVVRLWNPSNKVGIQ